MRPEITDRQRTALSLFYSLRRDCQGDEKIKSGTILAESYRSDYEPDVTQFIIAGLDDHLSKLVAEQMKRRRAK